MKSRMRRFIVENGPWVYAIIIVLAVVSTVIIASVAIHQNHKIRNQSISIRHQAALIQKERIETIARSCKDQNRRHDKAVIALFQLLKKSGVKQEKRQAAARPVLTLINALAPHQDCQKIIEKAVPSVPKSQLRHALAEALASRPFRLLKR